MKALVLLLLLVGCSGPEFSFEQEVKLVDHFYSEKCPTGVVLDHYRFFRFRYQVSLDDNVSSNIFCPTIWVHSNHLKTK